MKIVESWLREWVDPDLDTEALGHQLTMLGHEVDEILFEGSGLDGVIVAEVLDVKQHPNADRLSVCRVSMGAGEPVDVVCGAPNVVKGMKSPLAQPGVRLPNGMKLRKSKIRGIESNGMLCSALELGLGDDADGIIDLPADAPVGAPLSDFLRLPDAVIDVDLTPNRGDCFSVLGIARDLAALDAGKLKDPAVEPVSATIEDRHPVELVEPAGCPRFAGRVIRGIDASARSPLWMTERLRRAGLRAISPVVDITNYVMLEYGQPLHAYDCARLTGPIRPRLAKAGERVTLLDEKVVELRSDTLIITDDSGPIGIAGIMGGLSTAVTDATTDVFFEAAYWPPAYMAGRARAYGMHTDASVRFERGVDPDGQGRAVERATKLLLEIAGGRAGPLVVDTDAEHLPTRQPIRLRSRRLAMLLGAEIEATEVESILRGLQLDVVADDDGWLITPASHRFDLQIEADLIEEVARIHGYDSIPETTLSAAAPLEAVTETRIEFERFADTLIARDYHEVVTYSFVDAVDDGAFSGRESALRLSNPISSEMAVMRSSLWPGLISVAAANLARQQDRVRIFESSKSFHGSLDNPLEVLRIAGLVCGPSLPEQWGSTPEDADFFDIKSDVEALLLLADDAAEFTFEAFEHPALQAGQTAEIRRGDDRIGMIGKLHPSLGRRYDILRPVFLFELDAEKALYSKAPTAIPVSRFPSIRRDIAVVVDDAITAGALVAAIGASGDLIREVRIFDVYKGPGIEAGRKSVAIGLILQKTSRTLTDEDADVAMASAITKLQDQFGAELRD